MGGHSRRKFLNTAAWLAGAAAARSRPLFASSEASAATNVVYQPTLASLNRHTAPIWFEDGKFGIFIHWGLFSVPAFAPKGQMKDVLRDDYARSMVTNPYSEDYGNAIKDPTTPSAAYHRKHYGNMPYEGFRDMFNAGLKHWDPTAWATAFKDAGARYVVLTSKIGDGYCMWPSKVPNPHRSNWTSQRDLVGELATAVRAAGLHFGTYYDGGADWTFDPKVARSLGEYLAPSTAPDYPRYAEAHIRELIARYRPDVLWNDLSWPTDSPTLLRLFADYYQQVPQGAVNDRWAAPAKELGTAAGLKAQAELIKQVLQADPHAFDGFLPETDPTRHCDFVTPEWRQFADIQTTKWEVCHPMGTSWGYNRTETDQDYLSADALLTLLIEAVSKNGNLLLNVGPRGEDAQIPPEQLARLKAIGTWMRSNGEAIYGTRPWKRAAASTDLGETVRITQKAGNVNLILLGQVASARRQIRIKDLALQGAAKLLLDGQPVQMQTVAGDLLLTFKEPPSGFGPVVQVQGA